MRYYGMSLLLLQVLCGSHDLMSSQQESVATGTERQQRVKDHRTHVNNYNHASDSDTSDTDLERVLSSIVDQYSKFLNGDKIKQRLEKQKLRRERNERICEGLCCCCCVATILCCLIDNNHEVDHSVSTKTEPSSKPLCPQGPPVMGAQVEAVKDKRI